jgi:hypothetical protein
LGGGVEVGEERAVGEVSPAWVSPGKGRGVRLTVINIYIPWRNTSTTASEGRKI